MIEDSEIKTTVSPFAIRPGEIKVFDGKDGYVSMNQIIQKINVVNVNGQVLKTISGDYETIDLSNLKNGFYFINVITNKGSKVHKIIKK